MGETCGSGSFAVKCSNDELADTRDGIGSRPARGEVETMLERVQRE